MVITAVAVSVIAVIKQNTKRCLCGSAGTCRIKIKKREYKIVLPQVCCGRLCREGKRKDMSHVWPISEKI